MGGEQGIFEPEVTSISTGSEGLGRARLASAAIGEAISDRRIAAMRKLLTAHGYSGLSEDTINFVLSGPDGLPVPEHLDIVMLNYNIWHR